MLPYLANLLLFSNLGFAAADPPPAPTDVVAHWNFDGSSPSVALDVSGNAFDGAIYGAERVPGLRGGALLFDGPEVDGTADRVIVPDAPGLNVSGAITIEAIIKSLGAQPSGFIPLVAKNVPGASGTGYELWITGDQASNRAFTYMVTPDFSVDEWHHVVFQHDGTVARFYVDGELVDERPPGIVKQATGSPHFVEIGGSENESPAPGRGTFNGIIDEIRISRGLLDPSEFLHANEPPVALCTSRRIEADRQCQGTTSIDDGSFDPEGGAVETTQSPAGPYPLGTTDVTLQVVDDAGAAAVCSAQVEIVDISSPSLQCNAPATISPNQVPLQFVASAVDNCSVDPPLVLEPDCFKFTKRGKRIDKTESCRVRAEADALTILDSGGVGTTITWIVEAVDSSGNEIRRRCGVEVVRRKD